MKVIPRLVTTEEEFETLRQIRNDCLSGMTHHRSTITPEQQKVYRELCYGPYVRNYLYFCPVRKTHVGFSRLQWKDGFVYPTYGVSMRRLSETRSVPDAPVSYIRDIIQHAMLAAGEPLRGDLFASNEAIKSVDYALGWRPVGLPVNGIQQVEADWPPKFFADVEEKT